MDTLASGRLAGVASRYAAQIEALLNFQAERAALIAEESARRVAQEQKVAVAASVSSERADSAQARGLPQSMLRADALRAETPWRHDFAALFDDSDAASAPVPVRNEPNSEIAQGVVLDVTC